MKKFLMVGAVLLLGLQTAGCAFGPGAANLYAGRMPIACGTLECAKDKAKYHERRSREVLRAWEQAAKNKKQIERIYGERIPDNNLRICIARCYVLTNKGEAWCADRCAMEHR